ncbi:carboxylesterase [Mycobacterium bohemicum DSM 44277]|jgi:CubicO group peptidase (beta-lactamase class C family)|uniref:Serine hydrolase n=2 Tax=Mycobacterium bohemicum TaxID=56425 RepID=A0A1X1R4L4_MYCBE|nr:serine hydrolase domain-containing protein [Mycobacterium bohemicum]MCV6968724.1 beta-lactamase family protein [Mycobacterium bohemicum]ORU99197.1 serine hydrolase [Mycobacterium bohemicum]CPR05688.1 carboxylesterase [Mycobacterium bohemicum DSM 44277]
MVLKVAVSPDLIQGDVDAGYGKVADAFRANFRDGSEVGAAVAVYRDGVKVVDLWGGYRNGATRDPWQRDTMVNMFSTTKGVAALVVAVAVSRGLLSYDARVADYWPEFAQEGKGDVTVRQLLGHQAGLCALSPKPTLEDVADPGRLAPILAAQTPAWRPGSRHGYHAITLGWYKSELIRRTDPAGRTLGRFMDDEIVRPLGLDLHIGLPDSVDRARLAHVHNWVRAETLLHLGVMPVGFLGASLNPVGLTARAVSVPRGVDAFNGDYNRDDVRAVEIPSANGIGTARSVARMYGSAATGGAELGLSADTFAALKAPAVSPTRGVRDKVMRIDVAYSLGLCKPVPRFEFGSSGEAFGTPGFGGSFGCADPETGIGFAYVMNRLGFHLWSDPRELALRQALFRDVLGVRPQS